MNTPDKKKCNANNTNLKKKVSLNEKNFEWNTTEKILFMIWMAYLFMTIHEQFNDTTQWIHV